MKEPEQERQPSVRGLERLANWLELPTGAIADVPHLELEGNTQLRIENSGGLLRYQKNEIQIRAGKLTLQILGRNLEVKAMDLELLEVHGTITELHFFR